MVSSSRTFFAPMGTALGVPSAEEVASTAVGWLSKSALTFSFIFAMVYSFPAES